jgi:hypothetical protein
MASEVVDVPDVDIKISDPLLITVLVSELLCCASPTTFTLPTTEYNPGLNNLLLL